VEAVAVTAKARVRILKATMVTADSLLCDWKLVVVRLVLCLGTLGTGRQASMVEERENLPANVSFYLQGEGMRAFEGSVRAAKSASAGANRADTGKAARTAV
jgi:hypothetical protein